MTGVTEGLPEVSLDEVSIGSELDRSGRFGRIATDNLPSEYRFRKMEV